MTVKAANFRNISLASHEEILVEGTRPRLHILTITPFYPSEENEVSGCFVAESLRALQANGVASSVIAVDSIYHPRKKSSSEFPSESIRFFGLPGNFGLASAGSFLGLRLLSKVRQLHRRLPISVIHAHAALPCGDAAGYLSARLNIPSVVTIHGLDAFNLCFENGFAAQWRKKSSVAVYREARKVICISEKVERALKDGMRADVNAEIVYNGVDAHLFSPASCEDGPLSILMVGTLLAGKGHELVLKAMAALAQAHPELTCNVIGEGADRERFALLTRELQIADRVHFLGRRSRSEVAAAMRNCTIFVLPSGYEGLGCVYLEAMACGKPAIGCWGQGIDEIIEHNSNGWLIPANGLNELVEGLRALLRDANLRKRIGGAARQTILDGLTLQHQADRLMHVYEEAVS